MKKKTTSTALKLFWHNGRVNEHHLVKSEKGRTDDWKQRRIEAEGNWGRD